MKIDVKKINKLINIKASLNLQSVSVLLAECHHVSLLMFACVLWPPPLLFPFPLQQASSMLCIIFVSYI